MLLLEKAVTVCSGGASTAGLGSASTTYFALIKKQKFRLKHANNTIFFWKKAIGDSSAGRKSWEHINRLQSFKLESRF